MEIVPRERRIVALLAGLAIVGLGVLIALAFSLDGFGRDDAARPAADATVAAEAAVPTATPPGCRNPPTIRFGPIGAVPTLSPFVRINGRTYEPNTDPGSLGVGDLGLVMGKVLVAPDPRGDSCYREVEGAAVGLSEGTELHHVAGYDPAFRLGANVGGELRLFEVTENSSASTGADLFDIKGRVHAVAVRGYLDGQPFARRTDEPGLVASLVDDILAAQVEAPQPNGYGAWVLTLELEDGSTVVRAYEPRGNYLAQGIMLPASFAESLQSLPAVPAP